jgi:hypothetical protein
MSTLKEKIFGEAGYTTDLKLTSDELQTFRDLVNVHWLSIIKTFYPELVNDAKNLGIENYHHIADQINHSKLWPKINRVLPKDAVLQIKNLPFIECLKEEFGAFAISDIYDTEQRYGYEEIYWRLVRPNIESDVGPLHKDSWFHGAFNSGYGMFPDNVVTVKVWIPLYCEPGKNGLALAAGSHQKEFKYSVDMINGLPRPYLDKNEQNVNATLIPTEPGNLLIFNENMLHGGVVNRGDKTRVSAELTMVIDKASLFVKG